MLYFCSKNSYNTYIELKKREYIMRNYVEEAQKMVEAKKAEYREKMLEENDSLYVKKGNLTDFGERIINAQVIGLLTAKLGIANEELAEALEENV